MPHILPLIDEEYPCSGQGGVGGVGQFAHSGVVDEASDKQHEAWAAQSNTMSSLVTRRTASKLQPFAD